MIKIEYLCDHPEYSDEITRWIYYEFIDKNNPDLLYEDFHSFFKNCRKSAFPIRLVAIVNGQCAGTVSLVDNDLEGSSHTPWLGGLYVDVSHRNNGVGWQLLEQGKKIARDLGYKSVYLVTHTASRYYAKLGWQKIESCYDESGQKADVFAYNLCS